MPANKVPLPSHVEEAVRAISDMHNVHEREATRAERFADQLTSVVGRPAFLAVVVAIMAAWIIAALMLGRAWPDAYPFPLLSFLISCMSICIAILILASQRRADRLAQRSRQLALEVALLAEHKTSKIIDLMEELRRDLPDVHNRVDLEAMEMASKPDHETVLDIIEERVTPEKEKSGTP